MDDKKIEELNKPKKVSKFKKFLLMLGLSTAITTAATGCGDKEVEVEPATTTESVDETVVIEEETVVEEPVVTTPEEVTPVVEEIAITPVTVEAAEEYIANLTSEFPNEKPEVIRGLIALYNKPYFENENDYLTVMGVESASDIDSEYLKECVDYMRNTAGKSMLVYTLGYAEDQLPENIQSVSYYKDAIKYTQVIIPAELGTLTEFADRNVSTLVNSETKSNEFALAADNLASVLFDKKFGNESETLSYSIFNGEIPRNYLIEYSLMANFNDSSAFGLVNNQYFENNERMEEVSDFSYIEENLNTGLSR